MKKLAHFLAFVVKVGVVTAEACQCEELREWDGIFLRVVPLDWSKVQFLLAISAKNWRMCVETNDQGYTFGRFLFYFSVDILLVLLL